MQEFVGFLRRNMQMLLLKLQNLYVPGEFRASGDNLWMPSEEFQTVQNEQKACDPHGNHRLFCYFVSYSCSIRFA